jgi:hypothetical protein
VGRDADRLLASQQQLLGRAAAAVSSGVQRLDVEGQREEDRPASASGSSQCGPDGLRLDVLDRLEQLERRHEQQQRDDDEAERESGGGEWDGGGIEVTTQVGLGLTKGMRLPDAILVPDDAAA